MLAGLAKEAARKMAAEGAVLASRGVVQGAAASHRVLAMGREELRRRGLIAEARVDQENPPSEACAVS